MRKPICFLLMIPILALGCKNEGAKKGSDRPLNVIMIVSDDLGKQISCYGDDIIETPNIDALAARGMMFHNGYVTQASCSSSRSSILTGTWPHYNGQIGLAHRGFQMNGIYPNIVRSLKDAGYTTGIVGKLHVRPEEQFPFDFKRTRSRETLDIALVRARADSILTMAAGNPFFLYVNYMDPHAPFDRDVKGHPRKKFDPEDVHALPFQGVDDPEELQRIADYYGAVKRVDEGVGMLMDLLEQRDVLDHSVLVFIGDHGAPFARGKAACYESSVNIPYFVACPGIIEAGQESEALVSTADIYPTLMDILGMDVPAGVQGRSILRVLEGETEGVREHLFTEFTYHTHRLSAFFPRRAVRDERYKLIYNVGAGVKSNDQTGVDGDPAYRLSRGARYEGTWVREIFDRFHQPPVVELYDLQEDPLEKKNLADDADMAAVRDELLGTVQDWMEATDDPFQDVASIREELENPTVPQDR